MIELVYGGSGSGKSEFAENEITSLQAKSSSAQVSNSTLFRAERSNLFYIATMKVRDDEARRKVARHRNLRAKKNFITVEASDNLENAAEFISSSLKEKSSPLRAQRSNLIKKASNSNAYVLLECLSNLVANEMFLENGEIVESEKVVRKIEAGLEKLFSVAGNIVIVSNNVFDDGIEYDETTQEYQKALAAVNAFAARRADKVSEIVAGIEVRVK